MAHTPREVSPTLKSLGASCAGVITALLLTSPAQALVVYRVQSVGLADYLVYQASDMGDADCRIAVVNNRDAARDRKAWYFTDQPHEADVRIFVTGDRSRAHARVLFTSLGMASECRPIK